MTSKGNLINLYCQTAIALPTIITRKCDRSFFKTAIALYIIIRLISWQWLKWTGRN